MQTYLLACCWAFIQITVALSFCLMLVLAMRGRRPQLASAILAGACAMCLLLMISIAIPSEWWSLSLPSGHENSTASVISTYQTSAHVPQQTDHTKSTSTPKHSGSFALEPRKAVAEHELEISDASARRWGWLRFQVMAIDTHLTAAGSEGARIQLVEKLVWPCLLVMLIVAVSWIVGWWHVKRILHRSTPVDDARINVRLRQLAGQLRVTRVPRLVTSREVVVGATFGLREPIIVLSEHHQTWSDEQLTAVLSHELAHTLRGDYRWVLIGSLMRVVLWFHPLIHWCVVRLRLEQELAADQIAASTLGTRAYGRALAQLALASQHEKRMPNAVLAASQNCVLRRISMITQGRLLPKLARRRLSVCVTLLMMLAAIPLSAVRGQTKVTPQAKPNETAEAQSSVRPANAQHAKWLEVQRQCPPFQIKGTMVYRQDKMNDDALSPRTAWLARCLQVFTIGTLLPNDCEVVCESEVSLRWQDVEKQHGSMICNGRIVSAKNSQAGDLSRIFTSPMLSSLTALEETRQVAGRTARAYGYRNLNDGIPRCWIIDDEQGYRCAESLEQLALEIARPNITVEVPTGYEADFNSSALAMLYTDGDEWAARFAEFVSGSDKAAFFTFAPLLEGIETVAVFIMPNGDLRVRARFCDAETAEQRHATISSLLKAFGVSEKSSAAPASATPDAAITQWLASLKFQTKEAELYCDTTIEAWTKTIEHDLFHQPANGWLSLSSDASVKDGVLHLRKDGAIGNLPNTVHQTIDAQRFRGRRLRIEADIECQEDLNAFCGLAAWVNDEHDLPLNFRSKAADGVSEMPASVSLAASPAPNAAASRKRQRVRVEVSVPAEAVSLSFGVYSKHQPLRIFSLALEDAGSASNSVTPAPKFVTALNVPGRAVLPAATNLDFADGTSSPQAVDNRAAESKQNAQRR